MNEQTENTYGNWLRVHRLAAKLTQKEVGALADITPTYVSALETGAQKDVTGKFTQIDLDKCDRVSVALNRPILEGRAAAGYVPVPQKAGGEKFLAIALTVDGWSDENRARAYLEMEKVFDEFRVKEERSARSAVGKPKRADEPALQK